MKYATKKDLISYLGVSMATINRCLAQGMPCNKFKNIVVFDIDQVMEWWIAEGRMPPSIVAELNR